MKKFVLIFALCFCCFPGILNVAAQNKEQDEVIKIDTNLVSIPVVVNDRNGRHIPNLKQSDFSVFENGQKQEISFFASTEEPLNVVLLLDTSRSTQNVLGEIQDAADNFIGLLKPSDRAMIATFDYRVNFLSPLTSDRRILERAIDNVDIGEFAGTVMRDAIDEVVNKSFSGVQGRKAIILLTDGKDVGSVPTEEELLKELEESDVMIYSVFYETGGQNNFRTANRRFGGFGGMNRGNDDFDPRDDRRGGMNQRNNDRERMRRDDDFGGRRGGIYDDDFPMRPGQERRRQRQALKNENAADYLSQMAELTAGRFYENFNTDLNQTFAQIADELKKQYRIGYYPKDGTAEVAEDVRQIKVQVARQNVAVRARSTYRIK